MKPMHVTPLFIIWFVLQYSGFAIGQTYLAGTIQTSEKEGIPFANVLLLQAKDSSLVKGMVSSQSGKFRLDHIQEGTYLLMASMIGYKKTYSSHFAISAEHPQVELPALILLPETRQLEQVTVIAQKPIYEQQIDRTIIHVANSIISGGSTALEVLEKAPGVTVDRRNDGISLQGKDGVLLMIDGKQTYLAMADVVAMLRSMSSDNIEKVELITSPSAKYDAAGNSGIINIRLKKNNTVGTNGSLSIAGGSGRYDRERGSLQVNHRTQKLNLFGNVSATRGGNYWLLTTDQDRQAEDQHTFINQTTNLRFRDHGQNAKAGMDYVLGKNTTIGLVWNGFWSNHQESGPASSYFRNRPDGPVYMDAQTDKTLSNVISNQVGNLNVTHKFTGKGGDLTADVDIGHLRKVFSNALLTATTFADQPATTLDGLLNYMPVGITIFTAKTDYSQSLSKSWKMEAGYKYSAVKTDNDLTFSLGPAGELQPNPQLSNHFQYTEQINALYANFWGKPIAATEIILGLRAEHTHPIAHSLNLQKRVERNYLNLFPSVFISRTLSRQNRLTLSYIRRINRPNYELLNPGRSYADPYLYTQGNPYLQPQYTQTLEVKHGYKEKFFTSLSASYTDNLIFTLVQPITQTITERLPSNIGKSQIYTMSVNFPVNLLKGWSLQTTILGYYSRFQYRYLEQPFAVEQLSARLNASSAIILGKGWTAELSGWLNTPRMNTFIHFPWLGTVDAGLQKTLNARLKAKLSVQDLFHTNRIIGEIHTLSFNRDFRITLDTRVAMLNLTYTFGNEKLKGTRQRKTGSEDELQRTKE
ncbi:outer membrane beta-barrel family protein [Rhodocytophaga aerolata]|uniref:Outer membrane beta-barrel family protein n=1 Tax=Rhodocytophaga aerolata TaxID=455078 RepID=A0ABT8RFE0_9BACT|nr:outer membrane beta-barrel family protein [Rhodocytophaga aerolata]MDO1450827.1 outer membrane beta-barrel family protein [Rhodocytophaga aerolata]